MKTRDDRPYIVFRRDAFRVSQTKSAAFQKIWSSSLLVEPGKASKARRTRASAASGFDEWNVRGTFYSKPMRCEGRNVEPFDEGSRVFRKH